MSPSAPAAYHAHTGTNTRDERTAAAAPARDLVREAAQDAVDALADGEDGLTVRALLAAVLDDQSDDVIEDDV